MNINITTQNVTDILTGSKVAQADVINLHDGTYGLTITRTEDGYTVTDETGGDQDVEALAQALTVAAEMVENVADEDAEWMATAAHLRSIA